MEESGEGGEAAERVLVSEHAVHVARLASIPFGMAALCMVVSAAAQTSVQIPPNI